MTNDYNKLTRKYQRRFLKCKDIANSTTMSSILFNAMKKYFNGMSNENDSSKKDWANICDIFTQSRLCHTKQMSKKTEILGKENM